MPTVEDLHAAFAYLEDQAPTNCNRAALSRQQDRTDRRSVRPPQRALLVALAAVACVATVVAVSVALGQRGVLEQVAGPAPTEAAPTGGPPTLSAVRYAFSVGALPDMEIRDGRTGPDFQQIFVDYEVFGGQVASVLVYPAGGFRPVRPADATDVMVAGRPGFSGRIAPDGPGMASVELDCADPPCPDAVFQAVAWEYASNAWAIVQAAVLEELDVLAPVLMTIAEAVTFNGGSPARVPVDIGYLPDGMLPNSVLWLGDGTSTSTIIGFTSQRTDQLSLSLEISTQDGFPAPGQYVGTPITLGAFAGYYDETCGSLLVGGGGVFVAITSSELSGECPPPGGPARLSLEMLTDILEGLSIADPADPSTWLDLSAAIPG